METQVVAGRKKIQWVSQEAVLIYVTIGVFVAFSLTTRGFFHVNNFFTILRAMSLITVLGVGVTFVITAGEIDLSIGTLPALCGSILAVLLKAGMSLPFALLVSLAGSIVIGLINGYIIVNTSLPSIIITLATNMIAKGVAYIITNQDNVTVSNQTFSDIFGGTILGFPVIVLWMVALVAAGYFILRFLKFGRNLAFLGDNRSASYYAGIKVKSTLTMAFVLCGVYSFMAALMGVAQASSAAPWMISENMLTAIAATLIGGTALAGGKGNVIGTIVGAFFLTLITNGFLILGIEQWVLYLINGVVIIATLSWRALSRERV